MAGSGSRTGSHRSRGTTRDQPRPVDRRQDDARGPDAAQERDERARVLAELEELSQDFDFVLIDAGFYIVLRTLKGDSARRLYGSVLFGALQALFLFVVPVVVAIVSGTLGQSPVLAWLAFAAIWAVRVWAPIGDYATSSEQDMAVGRALSSVDDLKGFVEWIRRWRRLRFAASTSAALGTCFAVVIIYVSSGAWTTVPPGTIGLVLILLYLTGEQGWWVLHKSAADRMLARMRFDLPAFRPIDSPTVRQIVHSADGVTFSNAVWSATYVCIALVILPLDIGVVLPVVTVILGVCYASAIADALSTRRLISHMVERDRAARLDDLSRQIELLLARVPELSTDEEHRLELLRKTYESIGQSPTEPPLLPIAGKAVRAMIIPTLTFVALAAAEGTIERGVNAFLERLGL